MGYNPDVLGGKGERVVLLNPLRNNKNMKALHSTMIIVVAAIVILITASVVLIVFEVGITPIKTITDAKSYCLIQGSISCQVTNNPPPTWNSLSITADGVLTSCAYVTGYGSCDGILSGSKAERKRDNYFDKPVEEVLFVGDKTDLEPVDVCCFECSVDKEHTLTLMNVREDDATFLITSEPLVLPLEIGESEKVDVNDDGFYDSTLRLTSINADGSIGLEKKYILEKKNEGDKRYDEVEEPKKSSHVLFKMDRVYLDIVSYYVNSKGEHNKYVNYIAFLDLWKGKEANLIVGSGSAYLEVGKSKKFEIKDEVDGESSGYYNLKIELKSINSDGSITLIIEYISEKIPPEEKDIIIEEELPKEVPKELGKEQKSEERKKILQRELEGLYHVDYVSNEIVEEYRRHIPCGPYALYRAFKTLGFDITIESINEQRVGELRRGVLSIFDENAKLITWPDEMANIPKKFGLKVEVIKGKNANVETIIQKSDEGVVIALVGLKSEIFPSHWEDYSGLYFVKFKMKENPELKIEDFGFSDFYDLVGSWAREENIHELYVIKKKLNQ